ncbi:MAG: DNA mismatch repair protein MutS [Bacteroidales bacterium]|nr:DNA mismatch repair protein MutS [Bacteroidales bacterium]
MKKSETPLMRQYAQIKAQHPDTILLFRVGDFYETYGEDAIRAAQILGIVLTKRSQLEGSVEMAGFPYHAIDTYLPKLVRNGCRVAICEQLEDPKLTKTLVKRGITELVTPGVVLNDNVLEHNSNNFLACVHQEGALYGLSCLDISTGEFFAAEGDNTYIEKLLVHFAPREVLVERSGQNEFKRVFGDKFYMTPLEDWAFHPETTREKLLHHFKTVSLKGFGVDEMTAGITAAGAILHYLDMTKHAETDHISSLTRIDQSAYVSMDKYTLRNLELLYSPNEGGRTLIGTIDFTSCPMGARLLKRWISMPLKDTGIINGRLDAVGCLLATDELRDALATHIKEVGDMERIISKLAVRRATPRDLLQLKNAMCAVRQVRTTLSGVQDAPESLRKLGETIQPCDPLIERIAHDISENAPMLISKGNVIAEHVSQELDELRELHRNSTGYLLQVQQREIERTGIPSLKINFNNIFGYYIEVRNTHKDKVPEDWTRKQTLVNAERYITQELKEFEARILSAEDRIATLENELFNRLVEDLVPHIAELQQNAHAIAEIDCLLSYARAAEAHNYHRPELNDGNCIDIKAGRHPVIECQLPPSSPYIANDVLLDRDDQQILMITGPNMSGKSALLRQTALIVLMAQAGSFVPADSAKIGIIDRIFTRVGASDNLSQGESTFMVEMMESASILNNISERSLVLLDEIGRGTSTYDGISIAWAMAEYLHESPCRPKTLFATHYHELNEMEHTFGRIKNYHVSTKELADKVVFLRKLVRGGSEHSFGIHVAQMAGMPPSVVNRANAILKDLEKENKDQSVTAKPLETLGENRSGYQLSFFQLDDPVLSQIRDELKALDINSMTPLQALNKLHQIRQLMGLE